MFSFGSPDFHSAMLHAASKPFNACWISDRDIFPNSVNAVRQGRVNYEKKR